MVAYTFSPAAKLIDLVQPARPLGAVRNKMGFLQNAQVLRNRGTADRKVVRQFADRDGTVQKPVENRPAGRRLTNVAGQSLKKGGESGVLAGWKTVRGGLVPIYELSRQGDYCDGVRNFGDSAESTLSFGALT